MTVEHSNIPRECNQEQIKDLTELGSHEYYMNVLPNLTDDKRIKRGLNRIKLVIESLNQLKLKTICKACLNEINKQLLLQEQAIVEILESNPEGMS